MHPTTKAQMRGFKVQIVEGRYSINAIISTAVLASLWATTAQSASQPSGHIFNVEGEKCVFTQSTANEKFFHDLDAQTGTLVFSDKTCMKTGGAAGEVNAMMIRNFIAKPYSHDDAKFLTRNQEIREGSTLQKRGKCIQSETYSNVGVVFELVQDNDRILSVKHALALQGCN